MSNETVKDGGNPMAVHASKEIYFENLHRDPYGLKNPDYDWSGEDKFVAIAAPLAILGVIGILLAQMVGYAAPISGYAYVLFFIWIGVEIIGKMFFFYLVLNFNIKINYARKLGLRPWRKLKTYAIPFILIAIFGFEKGSSTITAVAMLFFLDILKTIGMEWNVIRRKSKVLQYAFVSWDRLEDRPYTMRYDVLEDVLRFAVYFPFIWIFGKGALLVMIPNLINQFGDGLAEPVGIRFGKHKYRAKSLWYQGRFWYGNFERSLEGSAMVFIVSVLVLFGYRSEFTTLQFVFLVGLLPILMTLAEAISPHTNDGPALAFVGCLTIWAVLEFLPAGMVLFGIQ